jgi:hypothetical protein
VVRRNTAGHVEAKGVHTAEGVVKRFVDVAERIPPLSGAVRRFRVLSTDDLDDLPPPT